MTINIEIGQPIANGKKQVNTYQTINNGKDKYDMRNYAVPEANVDQFVNDINKKEKKAIGFSLPGMILGGVIAGVTAWKSISNKRYQIWGTMLSIPAGIVFGCLPAALYEKTKLNSILKTHNAEKLKPSFTPTAKDNQA